MICIYIYVCLIYNMYIHSIMNAFFISFYQPCITSLFTLHCQSLLITFFFSKFSTCFFLKSKTKQLQSRSKQSFSGIQHAASLCIPSQWWQHFGGTTNVKAHIELNKHIFRDAYMPKKPTRPGRHITQSDSAALQIAKRYTQYNVWHASLILFHMHCDFQNTILYVYLLLVSLSCSHEPTCQDPQSLACHNKTLTAPLRDKLHWGFAKISLQNI